MQTTHSADLHQGLLDVGLDDLGQILPTLRTGAGSGGGSSSSNNNTTNSNKLLDSAGVSRQENFLYKRLRPRHAVLLFGHQVTNMNTSVLV